MIRILIFLGVVFALAAGVAWLADRPGAMVVTFAGYRYEVSLMVAAVSVAVVAISTLLLWWVVAGIWNSPRSVGRHFRVRRRDRGYQALSTGLISAGAGDAVLSRRMHKQASSQLSADQEPMLHLLDAQALLLEGRHDEARRRFEAMVADPETRLLGLRGLYLEARRQGEHEAARQYADQAAELAPQLAWAASSAVATRLLEEDYDGALRLVAGQAGAKQISREQADHLRAVLLTAKAMAHLDSDLATARAAALEAHRLQPDFVPAAIVLGRAVFRNDEVRKGVRVLEQIWKSGPHPEVADVYVHARPGDSAQDRLARARRLHGLQPDHVESELTVARAALEAGELGAARRAAERAVELDPRESAYLLLADIEEAETGDQGRIRQWLAKAVRAPRDPAWTADGHVSQRWLPISPVTGAIGAFEWRVPLERLGPVIDAAESEPEPAAEVPQLERSPAAPKVTQPVAPSPPPAATPETATVAITPAKQEPHAVEADALVDSEEQLHPPIPDDPGVDEGDEDRDQRGSRGDFRLF